MMSAEDILLEELATMSARPRDFVHWAFPWGEPGTSLESQPGPDVWQERVLSDLQLGLISFDQAIRIAIRSGHGVGKSALLSWLIWWAISTVEDTRGRVTANTKEQLMRVLWAEVSKWHQLFIARGFFKVTATAVFSADPIHEKTWRLDAIPWSEENPEAFAGLHNYGKRILIVCDEASAIADIIWEVLDGATTDADTQILWIVTGNPTRNVGRFRDCWERFSHLWWTYAVDARESRFSNKKQIAAWAEAWGEDSDFFRIRVRGEFPNASTTQLIPVESIRAGGVREVQSQHWEPLILAVDIARFGNNESVAVFRRGKDARTKPAARWRGLSVVETGNRIASMVVEARPDACFVDEGGVGGGVVDYLRHLGHSCIGVNFGSTPGSRPGGALVANKRAEMYVALRDWLREGGCIQPDEDLASQLVGVEYHYTKKTEIILVSKEDMRAIGRESPDWADALAMTFAFPVAARSWRANAGVAKMDYNPFEVAA